MKKIFILLLLLQSFSLMGMQRTASACMVLFKPTKQDAYTAFIEGGIAATLIAAGHPHVQSLVHKGIDKARYGAFIVPALVAWNSKAIKDGIMNQLPEMNNAASYCVSSGIRNALLYGGTAVAGYLFYTETLDALTKNKLNTIFNPLKAQGAKIKELAQITRAEAATIKFKIVEFAEQIKKRKKNQLELENRFNQKTERLETLTVKLQRAAKIHAQELEELVMFIKELNISELTHTIKNLQKDFQVTSANQQTKLQEIPASLIVNQMEFITQAHAHDKTLEQRRDAITLLSHVLDEDIEQLAQSLSDYAKALYQNIAKTKVALELANKLPQLIAANGDSDAEGSEDEMSDGESNESESERLVFTQNPRIF